MSLPLSQNLPQQKTGGTNASTSRPLYRGIDVSEFNGDVDFAGLKGQIDFAILRCGYGSDVSKQDDKTYQKNVQACKKAGIPYGVYLYSYAKNNSMAQSEASHILRLLDGQDPEFGAWYDLEDKTLPYGPQLVSISQTWCEALLKAGVTCVGLYASVSVMKRYLDKEELSSYEKWVAHWDVSCGYQSPGIWQFTDKGTLNGKRFDMNYAYKDYLDMTGGNMTQEKFNQLLEAYISAQKTKAVDEWAKDSWEKACRAGVLDGSAPQSPLTREQAAAVLDRLKLLDKQNQL